jgi:hypothetical protein
MSEQLPKEKKMQKQIGFLWIPDTSGEVLAVNWYRAADVDARIAELERDNASYANAHKVLLAERDKAQQLAMRQAAHIKRMSAGETDPPHCPSCDCARQGYASCLKDARDTVKEALIDEAVTQLRDLRRLIAAYVNAYDSGLSRHENANLADMRKIRDVHDRATATKEG